MIGQPNSKSSLEVSLKPIISFGNKRNKIHNGDKKRECVTNNVIIVAKGVAHNTWNGRLGNS